MKEYNTQLSNEEQLFLKEQLTKEIIENERTRALILGIVSLLLLIFSVGSIIFSQDKFNSLIKTLVPAYLTISTLIILVWRAYIIRLVLEGKRMQKIMSNQIKRDLLRYGWLFFEISIPSVLLIVLSFNIPNHALLSSPFVWFYFVVIILSTLSLDFWMSLFTGFTAAVEYMIIVLFLSETFRNIGDYSIISDPFFYFSRSVLLAVSGLASGFVAYRLRQRIYKTYITILETNRIVNLFDQQVSKEIVEELVSNYDQLSSKRKYVCIMFLDIRDFTSFAEKKTPEEIIIYQNQIFSFMIEIITKHHGIINQFLGDGYMATFGAPISIGNNCLNAVNAAIEIIETVNEKSKNEEIPPTKIGIGLHAGEVVAGNVGTSIRKQYSISGNTVILASRIEGLTKEYGAQLLVSKEVLDDLDGIDLKNEFKGSVILKGREKPIDIYKLL